MMTDTPCTGQMAPSPPASITTTPPSRPSCRRSLTTCSGWRTLTSRRLTLCQTLSPWSPCWSVSQSSGSGQFTMNVGPMSTKSPKSPKVIWAFHGSCPYHRILSQLYFKSKTSFMWFTAIISRLTFRGVAGAYLYTVNVDGDAIAILEDRQKEVT